MTPERSCIGCGAKKPKRALSRLVLDHEGQPRLDAKQDAPGRGAYLCGAGCLTAAMKRKAFQRAFRGELKGLDHGGLQAALGRGHAPAIEN